MSVIRIQMLTGPQSGLQNTFTQPKITFGRVPGNVIVVENEHLSRQHGEVVFQNGGWFLNVLSSNGASVNGRALKGAGPHPLRPGDVVGVGKLRLFTVQFELAAPAAPVSGLPGARPAAEAAPRPKKSKLWIGLGIYMAIMVVVMGVLALGNMGRSGDQKGDSAGVPSMLSADAIAAEIRRSIRRTPDERKAAEHLQAARLAYERKDADPGALFAAHMNFKLNMAFSGSDRLADPQDQLRFNAVEDELVARVQKEYGAAYAEVRHKRWDAAEQALRRLVVTYMDQDTRLYKHVQDLLTWVRQNRPQKRKGF